MSGINKRRLPDNNQSRAPANPFTHDDNRRIIKMWIAGHRVTLIAENMQRGKNRISEQIKRLIGDGMIDERPKNTNTNVAPRVHASIELIERAKDMASRNYPPAKIKNLTGLNDYQMAALFGLDLPEGVARNVLDANIAHLIDLRRAGYIKETLSYPIDAGDCVRHFVSAQRYASYLGSSANDCVESC